MTSQAGNRPEASRIIAIGGSTGGLEAARELLRALGEDVTAAVILVLHQSPEKASTIAELLRWKGGMEVKAAEDGDLLCEGTVFVAPPNRHVRVNDHHVQLSAGPREHRARPAIDPLFRSVAISAGASAIGILLSGTQTDGVEGLTLIRRMGGTLIVQEPKTAIEPALPAAAIARLVPDFVGSPREIGAYARGITSTSTDAAALYKTKGDETDTALWAAVSALEERASFSARLAARVQGPIGDHLAERYATDARDLLRQAHLVRQLATASALATRKPKVTKGSKARRVTRRKGAAK